MTKTSRAIIKVIAKEKSNTVLPRGHQRLIYGILRRYTPEVSEGANGHCFAELTGLRTFFKMTYVQMVATIRKDILSELHLDVIISAATIKEFEGGRRTTKKSVSVSTYTEMNSLFRGAHFIPKEKRSNTEVRRKVKLIIPFLGKVN